MPAHHPEPPFRRIVGEAAADGEVLDDLVAPEIVIAEQAGGVQGTLSKTCRVINKLAARFTSARA